MSRVSEWFIDGPNASLTITCEHYHVEALIQAMAISTGDDMDEYTCTDLNNPTVVEDVERTPCRELPFQPDTLTVEQIRAAIDKL